LAGYDVPSGTTIVVSHRVYDAFGTLRSETAAGDFLFGFTGRPLDPATGFQNNLNRWYDAEIGQWVTEDPIGFAGGDANVRRYVGNGPTNATDPSGLESPWWSGTKPFFHELFVNEIYGGTKALVTGEAGRRLGERCGEIVETKVKAVYRNRVGMGSILAGRCW
jgi:RHS repeat-associated protein